MTLALTDDCLLVTSLTTKKVNRKEIVHAYALYIHEPVQKNLENQTLKLGTLKTAV